jgi:repressor LexA
MALTRRQREILDYIREFISEQGYSPSLEEIGAHFGLSSVATASPDFVGEVLSLPLLGEVAAGQPIEALENPEPIFVPAELVPRGKDLFVLRVRGSSMIDEQIRDGDYVVVESRAYANQGETVVALVHGEEATLKKFYRQGPVVRLVPANETLQPMEFPAEDVLVRGVVRGLLRSY